MLRTRVTGVAMASALAFGLVACSAEADPQTTPSATTPTTPSPTSPSASETTAEPQGPAEPTLPPAAKASGTAGAGAFVRYYIRLLNFASRTGDVRRLRTAADNCDGCRKYEKLFASTYSRGGSFTGNLWTPYGITVVRERHQYVVLTVVKAGAGKYRPRVGAKAQTLKPDRYSLRFTLKRVRGTWSITSFEGR
jgi:hypothetical protein